MLRLKNAPRWFVAGIVAIALAGCGGGGTPNTEPEAEAEAAPSGGQGPALTLAQQSYFVFNQGDTWLYDKRVGGSTQVSGVTRTVLSGPDATGDIIIRELEGPYVDDTEYRAEPSGLRMVDPLGGRDSNPGLYKAIPSFLEYPAGPYFAGSIRRIAGSGSLESDQDGDGVAEMFEAELIQTFVGIEKITVMGVASDVAHFSLNVTVRIQLSGTLNPNTGQSASFTIRLNENAYFAEGLGLVRARRSGDVESNGTRTPVFATYTLDLRAATLNGVMRSSVETALDRDAIVATASTQTQGYEGPIERVLVSTQDATGRQLYVKATHTDLGVQSVAVIPTSAAQTTLEVRFRTAQFQSAGARNDVITVLVCFDVDCRWPVSPSPLQINTTYLITNDAVGEPGIEPLQVRSRVGLTHDVLDAEYSKSLGAIVMVSSWPENALYLYDAASGKEHKFALNKLPIAVSVSPDGLHAAIGHDALVTWVDLRTVATTSPVFKQLNLTTKALDVVLDGHGHVHVTPAADQWVQLHSIDVATNTAVQVPGFLYPGARAKLRPTGNALYTANNGLSPDDIAKYTLRDGVATYVGDSPYHGDYSMCGNLWISDDGDTIYTACGNTFRASEVAGVDMTYSGALPLSPGAYGHRIVSLSQSTAQNEIVLIEGDLYECEIIGTSLCYHRVRFYGSDYLTAKARYALTPIAVAGQAYAQRGVAVFHDAGGQGLYLVSRLAGMPNPAAEFYISVLR